MKTLTLASLAFIIGSSTAMAAPLVDQRQQNQLHRIYNGVQNGDLNFRETVKLLRGQARIHRAERRFKASGAGLTQAERAQLFWMQTRQDVRIYNKKHN